MYMSMNENRNTIKITFCTPLLIENISQIYCCIQETDRLFDHGIELDMSNVSEIDSAGVQLLIYLQSKCVSRTALRITHLNEPVEDSLGLLGFQNLLSDVS